jgi:hypothetical protein
MSLKSLLALAIAGAAIVGCGSSEPEAAALPDAPKTQEPAAGTAPQGGDAAKAVAAPSNN